MECFKDYFIHNFRLKPISEFDELILRSGVLIYEVIRIEQGFPLFLEDHLNRLFYSADISNLSIIESYCDLEKLIDKLVQKNKTYSGKIKLVIRFDKDTGMSEKDLLIYFTPHYFPTDEEYTKGVYVGLCSAVRTNPNAKVLNTTARDKANKMIAEGNFFEVLLVDNNGFITEGSKSNVFFIKGNTIITAPEKDVLNGVTRKTILKLCKHHEIELREEKISYSDIQQMDSVFLSGTSLKILPVKLIGETAFNTSNNLLTKLSTLYNQSISEYLSLKKSEIH